MRQSIRLSTGRFCELENPALPFLASYHVVSFPLEQGPPSRAEVDEVLLIAARKARELGRRYFQNEECFSLIYNGRGTRRKPWLHVHIIPAGSTHAKRLAFLAFSAKRLLRFVSGAGRARR